ncbi:hypothetical protein [Pontibacter roseus]|uniref:hypothetical protein n=1 Tax=Pontibacter roseus TaxID=336989 RepID=UPI00036AB2F2|nr:hypothetical protein [Pontibacter roseus]
MKKPIYFLMVAGLFTFASCESREENRAEEGMEEVEGAAEEAGDEVEEAADEAEDATDRNN